MPCRKAPRGSSSTRGSCGPAACGSCYLGAPLEEFSVARPADEIAAIRAELGVAPGDFVVGTITRLHDSKGNEYLVDAARRVLDARPQARFYLFGEGPLRPALEAQARALGLGDRFVFGGFVKDVARVLGAFDMSVFPSLWEGTPLTVFEAMAAGRPIVATDADGLIEVLTHERNALIVPSRDSAALAGAIVRLMDDRRAARAARRRGAAIVGELRHRDVRPQDGAALRDPRARVARDPPQRRRQADLSFLTGSAAL